MQPGEKAALRVGAQLVSDFIPRTARRHDGERPSNVFMSKPGSSVDNAATPLADPSLKGTGPATTEPPWHIIPHDIIPNSSRSQGVNEKDLNDEDVTASTEENIFEAAGTVCLGKLYLFSSPVPDCILIYGTLIEGPMFNTSPDYLQFQVSTVHFMIHLNLPLSSEVPILLWLLISFQFIVFVVTNPSVYSLLGSHYFDTLFRDYLSVRV